MTVHLALLLYLARGSLWYNPMFTSSKQVKVITRIETKLNALMSLENRWRAVLRKILVLFVLPFYHHSLSLFHLYELKLY